MIDTMRDGVIGSRYAHYSGEIESEGEMIARLHCSIGDLGACEAEPDALMALMVPRNICSSTDKKYI